eukprot:324141-Pyramimonas_sp.AAC.1
MPREGRVHFFCAPRLTRFHTIRASIRAIAYTIPSERGAHTDCTFDTDWSAGPPSPPGHTIPAVGSPNDPRDSAWCYLRLRLHLRHAEEMYPAPLLTPS